MMLIGVSVLYLTLMFLTLALGCWIHFRYQQRCHYCHTAEKVVAGLAPFPVCLDCFVTHMESASEGDDPQARIPTVVMHPLQGGDKR